MGERQTIPSVGKNGEKSEPLHVAGGNVTWYARCRNSSAVPQNVKPELPHNPAITLLGLCPKEMKIHVHSETNSQLF